MNVIVSGCNGFLAHHLINEIKCKKPKWSLYGTDIKNLNNQLANFSLNNLKDKKNWMTYLKDKNPEIIFHLIGLYGIQDNKILLESNFKQSMYLFESIIDLEIDPTVVIIGSAAQYGVTDPKDNPITENHKQNPTNFYGLVKKWQEELALFYYSTYGLKVVCTRPSNFIGKGLSKLLTGFLTEQFSKPDEKIKLEITSKEAVRDYIDVRDVSRALIELSELKASIGECYNISSSTGITTEYLINLYSKISKKEISINEKGKTNPLKIYLSNEKLKSNINWRQNYQLEDSIKWCLGL